MIARIVGVNPTIQKSAGREDESRAVKEKEGRAEKLDEKRQWIVWI